MPVRETVRRARESLGRVGVWVAPMGFTGPADVRRAQAVRIEAAGYRSIWTGETPAGSDVFVALGALLSATDRLVAGSGIANVWAHPAPAAHAGATTLNEIYPDRFVLGLGVGYPAQAAAVGRAYGKPLATMRDYLDDLDRAPEMSTFRADGDRRPETTTVLAAVGPKMLGLAAERSDGAHPFAQPVANTALARSVLGPDKLLIPEQAVAFDPDPAVARRIAREYRERTAAMAKATGLDQTKSPYVRNLVRLGYSLDEVLSVSDRIVDETIAYGDERAIAARVREHLDAGADHVLINVINGFGGGLSEVVDVLERIAPEVTA